MLPLLPSSSTIDELLSKRTISMLCITCISLSATSGGSLHKGSSYTGWTNVCYVTTTSDVLVMKERSSQTLNNLSSVIRYTLIHPNAIQRLNISGFNWKSSLTLNTAKFIEGKENLRRYSSLIGCVVRLKRKGLYILNQLILTLSTSFHLLWIWV